MINEQALKDRLKSVAREKNIPFNVCWKQLLLERFLSRLARSGHFDKFIFKGGFLLSYFMEIGRETKDLDFLLTRIHTRETQLKKAFNEIITAHSQDGFIFSFDSIELLNQPHMDYPGYRIVLNAAFAKMKDKIQVDVGTGDIVNPLPREIQFVRYQGEPFFENEVSLLVYPIEAIFSEKLETILSKGAGNSRMKDYHDLFLLIRNDGIVNLDTLRKTITNTFSNRGTQLRSIQFDENSLGAIQKLWSAHLRGLGDNAHILGLPRAISTVIQELNKYVARACSDPKVSV